MANLRFSGHMLPDSLQKTMVRHAMQPPNQLLTCRHFETRPFWTNIFLSRPSVPRVFHWIRSFVVAAVISEGSCRRSCGHHSWQELAMLCRSVDTRGVWNCLAKPSAAENYHVDISNKNWSHLKIYISTCFVRKSTSWTKNNKSLAPQAVVEHQVLPFLSRASGPSCHLAMVALPSVEEVGCDGLGISIKAPLFRFPQLQLYLLLSLISGLFDSPFPWLSFHMLVFYFRIASSMGSHPGFQGSQGRRLRPPCLAEGWLAY